MINPPAQFVTERVADTSRPEPEMVPDARSPCSRPLAAPGLTSYRARGPCGWIMIGARNTSHAWIEAMRSTPNPFGLEVWNAEAVCYVPVTP